MKMKGALLFVVGIGLVCVSERVRYVCMCDISHQDLVRVLLRLG